eukprot:580702-Pleurochrysis_carterae.AAC.1
MAPPPPFSSLPPSVSPTSSCSASSRNSALLRFLAPFTLSPSRALLFHRARFVSHSQRFSLSLPHS